MAEKPRILIIDDHPTLREGLRAVCEKKQQYEVVGEAGTAEEGMAKALSLKPDLIILDVSLPDRSGLELLEDICGQNSDCRILILSVHSKVDFIRESFQKGASGYLVKESAVEKIRDGIETVLRGEYYMDSYITKSVVCDLLDQNARIHQSNDVAYGGLTPREQQVLRYLAEGVSVRKIADELYISPKTVENHRTNIMGKLDLHSTVDLVRFAARIGLIDVDLWKD